MKKRLLVACGTLVFVSAVALSAPAPAAPGDASQLQGQIRAALRSAKSFVMTVSVKPAVYAPKGGTMVYTVVAPNRYRQQVTGMPGGNDDTIIIGHQVYGHDSGAWDVQPWSDHLVTGYESNTFALSVVSVGADQTVNGKTVGSFVLKYPPDENDAWSMNCTYDKQSFRPLQCASAGASIGWRFDDPSTVIPTPANAKPAG
jgi:hypothetical protein